MRCVVVGGGVVGLAVTRALALKGVEVFTLEASQLVGSGTSSRNSEVIHAGIYYEPGSLKAKCCVEGRRMLYSFCDDHHVKYRKCGKLVVATNSEQEQTLDSIFQRSRDNGLAENTADGLLRLTEKEAKSLEPELECTSALFSPSTGIIDSHGFMVALQGHAENLGAAIVTETKVKGIELRDQGGFRVHTETADEGNYSLDTDFVVNCGGLSAASIASGIHGQASWLPEPRFAKGNYYRLQGRAPFSHLIYPVPEEAGLGVHITVDLGGQARFGPDVEWLDVSSPDEIDYSVDPSRSDSFYEEIRKYWPGLPDNSLYPDYSGIRPKLQYRDSGESAKDFLFLGPDMHGVFGLVHLLGIESPGLTSSLSLAELTMKKLGI